MIKNESEIRIALQAILVTVLAFSGYWGCAIVVMFILIPWKPIFAAGGYLAQPIVDWRMQKARPRNTKSIAQIERELDAILAGSNADSIAKAGLRHPPFLPSLLPPHSTLTPTPAAKFQIPKVSADGWSACEPGLKEAIAGSVRRHIGGLPTSVLHNMELVVEQVSRQENSAVAEVCFKSSNVSGLRVRHRYTLGNSGGLWEVKSCQPSTAEAASLTPPSKALPMAI